MILAGGIAVLAKQEAAAPAPAPTPPSTSAEAATVSAEANESQKLRETTEAAGELPSTVGGELESLTTPASTPPVQAPELPPSQEAASEVPPGAPSKWRASPTEKPSTSVPPGEEADELVVASPARSTRRRTTSSDPLQAVDSFVDRNRREADEAIRQLNSEAKELRERLKKVESALARWQKLSQALNQQTEDSAVEAPARSRASSNQQSQDHAVDTSPHEQELQSLDPADSPK